MIIGGGGMSLVKCPECGKENVSDTAECCPSCGYGIKAHFTKIKMEEIRRESERQAEIRKKEFEAEQKRRQEERIKSVPKLEKPQLTAPIVVSVISVLIMLLGFSSMGASEWEVERSVSHGNGDPHFQGGFLIVFGLCILGYAIYLFSKRISQYNLSRNNFEEYQRQVIREQDELQKRLEAERAAKMKQQANMPKCPVCGSTNISKISTLNRSVSVATVGLASSKIGKQYECKNCKHKW